MKEKKQQTLFNMENAQTGRVKQASDEQVAADYRASQMISGAVYQLVKDIEKENPDMAGSVLVTALLRTAGSVFLEKQGEEDPRWFVAMANAMLTVEGHHHKRKILFPLNPWYLPEEVKFALLAAGLATPEELGLKE